MKNIVMKFGGSSVQSILHMQNVADRVIEKKQEGYEVVVVLSAMGKTTNQLLDLAKQVTKYPSKRETDMLISTGEQVSISLFTMILKAREIEAVALTGLQAGIKTFGEHLNNKIDDIDTTLIEKHLNQKEIVVVAGFQGVNELGDITTLGRGGSDTSAVAIAAKLKCDCEIYTDVDGIYTADPRVFADAKKLESISYEEMKEMAFLGAKVMEPRSIEIAHRNQVKIYVASSLTKERGTYIMEETMMERQTITGLSVSDKVMMVTLRHVPNELNIVADLFMGLAQNEVNVDMITQSPSTPPFINVSFTAGANDFAQINEVLDHLTKTYPSIEIELDDQVVKVSVVGQAMRHQSGVAARLFQVLSENQIEFKLVTTSEISISYTISKELKDKAILAIANAFDLGESHA
ncbi:MAG: aspartate kinase [Acholeplasmataceae bacterium]